MSKSSPEPTPLRVVIAPEGRFRLNARNMFLTYPRCLQAKEVALERIVTQFGAELAYAVVCQEHHEATVLDGVGGTHLHAVIGFHKPKNFRDPHCLDFVAMQHGDYKSRKGSLKQALTYLTKEDKSPAVYGLVLADILAGKDSVYENLAKMILEAPDLDEAMSQILQEHPGQFLNHQRKLQEFTDAVRRDRKRHVEATTGSVLINGEKIEIGAQRTHRQKQYYISGAPGIGKTSILNKLREAGFRGFAIPYDGHWEEWDDEAYDFGYADEFLGQVKITEMNAFLDGAEFAMNCRFKRKVKKKNIPVFVLSNVDLYDQYKSVPDMVSAAFQDRFITIKLMQYPNVEVTIDQSEPEIRSI